ncbi:MAG: hypothetical protein MAG451_00808 [Anaerolineales bacterium]|nr:hypothetical protein [Anaerolineales bacterium]
MQHRDNFARSPNRYIVIAVVLGVLVVALSILPNFVDPTVVRRHAKLQVAAEPAPTSTPGPAIPTPPPGRTPTSTPSGAMQCQRYQVQAGDSLRDLARRFGTTEIRIALANDLYTADLTASQILIICTAERTNPVLVPTPPLPPTSSPPPTPAAIGEPVDVVMNLTYPSEIYNRKSQWIQLSIELPQTAQVAGASLLPDVAKSTELQSVTLPTPEPPRLPADQTAKLVERWLSAELTGSHITPRSHPQQENQTLSKVLETDEPMTWEWLFSPAASGDYVFGLDVFSSGEFELLNAGGDMTGTVRTDNEAVWSHNFQISVDEIFGIPRQWWLLASGLGAALNLLLGLIQLLDAT